MLGRDHCLSGAVVFAAGAGHVMHLTPVQFAVGTVLTGGAALLPDADEPHSTIARQGGFLTVAFAHVVRKLAGGHRHGTHSLIGAALFTLTAWAAVAVSGTPFGRVWLGLWLALMLCAALRALPFTRGHLPDVAGIGAAAGMTWWHADLALVPVCVGVGVLAHIAGDELTHGGCPLFWPASQRDFHLLPKGLRFTTGKFAESLIVSPLLVVALFAALAVDTGLASLVTRGAL